MVIQDLCSWSTRISPLEADMYVHIYIIGLLEPVAPSRETPGTELSACPGGGGWRTGSRFSAPCSLLFWGPSCKTPGFSFWARADIHYCRPRDGTLTEINDELMKTKVKKLTYPWGRWRKRLGRWSWSRRRGWDKRLTCPEVDDEFESVVIETGESLDKSRSRKFEVQETHLSMWSTRDKLKVVGQETRLYLRWMKRP